MSDFILNLVRLGAGVAADSLVRPPRALNFTPNLNAVQPETILDEGPAQDISIQRAAMSTPASSQFPGPAVTAEPTQSISPPFQVLPSEPRHPTESTPTRFSTPTKFSTDIDPAQKDDVNPSVNVLPLPVQEPDSTATMRHSDSVAATRTSSPRSSFRDGESKSKDAAISQPRRDRDYSRESFSMYIESVGETNELDSSQDLVKGQELQPDNFAKPGRDRDLLTRPSSSAFEIQGGVEGVDREEKTARSFPERPLERENIVQPDDFVKPKPGRDRDILKQSLPSASEIQGGAEGVDRAKKTAPSFQVRPPERENIAQPDNSVKPKPGQKRDLLTRPSSSASEIRGEGEGVDRAVELVSSPSHQPVRPIFRPQLTSDEFVHLEEKTATTSKNARTTRDSLIRGALEPESMVTPKPIATRTKILPSSESRQKLAQLPGGSKSNQPAGATSESRSVQVHIGTIEVRAASPSPPPPLPPRIKPQGFEDYERTRTYVNWYE